MKLIIGQRERRTHAAFAATPRFIVSQQAALGVGWRDRRQRPSSVRPSPSAIRSAPRTDWPGRRTTLVAGPFHSRTIRGKGAQNTHAPLPAVPGSPGTPRAGPASVRRRGQRSVTRRSLSRPGRSCAGGGSRPRSRTSAPHDCHHGRSCRRALVIDGRVSKPLDLPFLDNRPVPTGRSARPNRGFTARSVVSPAALRTCRSGSYASRGPV